MSTPPNVIWITTDQQFAGAMSCAGNRYIETPGMDRLARAGTRFERAYCASPGCAPSRASMLTGRLPSATMAEEDGAYIRADHRPETIGRLLADAGYLCAYAGKWSGGDRERLRTEFGFRDLWGKNDRRVPEAVGAFLTEDRDRPVFLSVNFDNPHTICEWSRDQTPPWGSVSDVPPGQYPPLPANHAVPAFEPKAIRDYVDQSTNWGAMEGATPNEWRAYRHAYYRLIERADAGIARVLDALQQEDLFRDSLVIFTSDHGDHHGAHQLIQKLFLYEESARVPFIISPPGEGVGDGGDVDDLLVSSGLDLLPTTCSYAGVSTPEGLHGQSLRPRLEHGSAPDREFVVAEADGGSLRGRMIRSEEYKYVVYHRGRHNEQLHHLASDPGEMVNLAVCEQYRDELDRHREHLLEWCETTGDTFRAHTHPEVPMIPGYEFDELWPRFIDREPGAPE